MADNLKKLLPVKVMQRRTAVSAFVFTVVSCFPAFAEDTSGGTSSMSELLASFTTVAAWMWSEIGLLLTWILSQPILLLAMSLFFVGAIVSFFIRVFHSV